MKRFPRFKRIGYGLMGWALGAAIVFAVLDAVFPFPVHKLTPPSSTRIVAADGTELRRFLAADGMWRFPITLDEVTPELVTALVESEDRWFFFHPGVNPLSIVRAAWGNATSGRIVSGASTIPMQVARMCTPRKRTLPAKIIEAFRAMQLTLHYSKQEILETYLNMAPFGGNIMGVGSASRLYFQKPPDQLSLGESVFLSVLPRSPNKYNPVRHPKAALKVRNRVLSQLANRGAVETELTQHAMRQPLVAKRKPSAMLAPHFAQLARTTLGARPQIQTSLDLSMQRTLERLVTRHVQRTRPQGLTNAAAVVINRQTHEILALAGSADFFEDAYQGQVNNALAPRSPGSTLKPFIYALAFDKGLAIPESNLLDVPTDFSGYAPQNYTGAFSGQVTTAQALVKSLNVPAVRLLNQTGTKDFHALLKRGGLETINRPASHYGLALALGACEVRLLDLTNLYGTLAEGGEHKPWRLTKGSQTQGIPLVSHEASRVVSEILTQVTRPDMPESWKLTQSRPVAGWKTGTSFGHKDAWAVGFGATLAVGVWVGNPDGTAVKGISGASHAGPLFFEVLRALEPEPNRIRLTSALNLRHVQLCARSRHLAGPDCPKTITATAGPKLLLPRCTEHKRIMVDTETGLRLEGDCLLVRPSRAQVALTTPPELAAWLGAQGKSIPALPELSPTCNDVPAGKAPKILSPSETARYVLRHDAPAEFQQIVLKAISAEPEQTLWWYVDNQFIGTTDQDKKLFYPMRKGKHTVSVTDSKGRTHSITFHVER